MGTSYQRMGGGRKARGNRADRVQTGARVPKTARLLPSYARLRAV